MSLEEEPVELGGEPDDSKVTNPADEKMYTSIAGEDGLANYDLTVGSVSNYTRQEGDTYNRAGYNFGDYDDQRPCEKIPVRHHDIMKESERLYNSVGLVRNMIDLMTDFTMQGVRIVHPNKNVEKFYRNWFTRINGLDRSERFCANLYKFGNVIVKRRWAKLKKADKNKLRRSRANLPLEHAKGQRGWVPSRYTFLNPSTVQVIGGEIAKFISSHDVIYGIKIPFSLQNKMGVEDAVTKKLIEKIPADMRSGLNSGVDNLVPLDPDNLIVDFYKKEDWQLWSKPIIYGIFRDLRVLEKLKLADLTALDGAVDRVRIFKLGSLEEKIMPTQAAFSKLSELLRVNTGAGTRNIVWGPDITMEESSSDVSTFLGEKKYIPTMNAIYGGLGIPPSLTGANGIGGTTNNLVSLKALIKRLTYVRSKLIKFWEREFELVRQGMNFRSQAPRLEFDQNNLGDEEAEKRLFIELADRDIVSYEFVQERFGLDPESASNKIEDEWKQRNKKKRVEKATPFHKTQFDDDIKRSLISNKQVTPAEVGVDLEPRKPGDTTNLEIEPVSPGGNGNPGGNGSPGEGNPTPTKPKKGNGRPPQTPDSQPRKKRRFVPVIKAAELWAQDAQVKIAELVNPVILSNFDKKSMRSLTAAETEFAEKTKFGILFNTLSMSDVTEQSIQQSFKDPFPRDLYRESLDYIGEVEESLGRNLTFAEKHNLHVEVYLDQV